MSKKNKKCIRCGKNAREVLCPKCIEEICESRIKVKVKKKI